MSTLKADTIQNTSGGAVTLTNQSAAKAWANLNGSTFGLRDSFNTSSATDNGTGNYTYNWSSSLANANYCAVYSAGVTGVISAQERLQTIATGSYRLEMNEDNSSAADSTYSMLMVNGDLA